MAYRLSAAGSTRGCFSSTFTTSICPFLLANRSGKLSWQLGSTLGSWSRCSTSARWPFVVRLCSKSKSTCSSYFWLVVWPQELVHVGVEHVQWIDVTWIRDQKWRLLGKHNTSRCVQKTFIVWCWFLDQSGLLTNFYCIPRTNSYRVWTIGKFHLHKTLHPYQFTCQINQYSSTTNFYLCSSNSPPWFFHSKSSWQYHN